MMQQKELTAQVDSSFFKSEIDAGLWAGMLAGNGKTR